jgi:hypothetical protein
MRGAGYPATVAECLDERARYRRGVVGAVRAFAREGPWRGTLEERKEKFGRLNAALARAYEVPEPALRFEGIDGSFSGASTCRRGRPGEPAVITMRGKLSVVTYLHEFAHALGRDERGACRWSLNVFRRVFPAQFARLRTDGHTVRRTETRR